MFVLDTHCDTPSEIFRGRDMSLDNAAGHVDLPKIERSIVDGAFFALYVPAEKSPQQAWEYAHILLESTKNFVGAHSDKVAFAFSAKEAEENKERGLFSVMLALENGSALSDDLSRIDTLHEEGIRYITLCHSANNVICDSCASSCATWNGLSRFGREVVKRMNEAGILVDVSHISDKSFFDVVDLSTKPVVATHSCCRALASHPRNMTDEMIRCLASNGGVIQINFYPVFLSSDYKEKMPSYKRIGDHIDHVAQILGNVEHIGLGSDFDGIEITPDGMEDISKVHLVFEDLVSRGYSQEDIRKIAGANFFRIWS